MKISFPGLPTPTIWKWGVIQSNLFVLKDSSQSNNNSEIVVLDDCTVIAVKNRAGSLWASRNYLFIMSTDKFLYKGKREFSLYCRNGKEMEEWYINLRKATNRNSTEFEKKEAEKSIFFNNLHETLSRTNKDNCQWFNFLLHRMFYNVHDDCYFEKIVKDKIQDKIKKLNIPKVLKEVSVDHISFGPNLPIFENLKLLDEIKDGYIAIDSDLTYRGGFKIKFSLVISIELLGRTIEIPASLSATVKHISGKVLVHCAPPPADRLWIGFYESPNVDVEIDSFISNTKVGPISSIIAKKLENEIIETLVLPDMEDFSFPKPSSKDGHFKPISHMMHEEIMQIVQKSSEIPIDEPKPLKVKDTPLPPVPTKKEKVPDLKDYDLPLLVEEVQNSSFDSSEAPPLPIRHHIIALVDGNPPTPGGAYEYLTRPISLKDKISSRVFGVKETEGNSESNSEITKQPPPPLPTRSNAKRDSGFRDFLKEKFGGLLN